MSTVFTLDGQEVTAATGETIWQVAKRLGTTIPHLCHSEQPDYRADGNCRLCMVEVAGERALVASCIRPPRRAWWSIPRATGRSPRGRR